MALKSAPGTLIHCDACGEEYSATYKRCPFCGEKPGPATGPIPPVENSEDDYVFEGQELFDGGEEERPARSKGGKRLAQGDAPGPINWPRLITFICSLVIIAAALVIVFAVIYPKIHSPGNADPGASVSPSQTVPPSADPSEDVSGDPAETDTVSPDPAGTDTVSPEPDETPGQSGGVTGLTLNRAEFSLTPNESWKVTATVTPAGWDGTVTWSSSNTSIATVSADGTVTNVNTSDSVRRVTITAAAGEKTASVTVYCTGSAAGGSTPAPSTNPSSGGITAGATGKITGASSGLRVRSGPGTSYDVVASLVNGSEITVVAAAESGWYQISFAGSGGRSTTGYILGEYISVS